MPAITLGNQPEQLRVVLVKDSDFVSTLTNELGPWPTGVRIELRFGDYAFPATIVGDSARFHVPAEQVNEIVASSTRSVALFAIESGTPSCWAKGTVVRR